MPVSCTTCGLESEEPLEIRYHGQSNPYCCFECAITPLAPECGHCGCKVIGHGTYGDDGMTYCCQHCVDEAGETTGFHAPTA